jgi:hypothetical protein
MDPQTYQRLWTLHLRAARCQDLSAEERALYQGGLKQIQQGKIGANSGAGLRELRAAIAALQAEHAHLFTRSEELDAEIAALEARLDERL